MKYIIGISSYAEVIYSILATIYPIEQIKFASYPYRINEVDPTKRLNDLLQDNYCGGLDDLLIKNKSTDEFIIGIRDNKIRKEIAEKYTNLTFINAIHSKAQISTNIIIGNGNVICEGVVIQAGTKIGNHNIINTNSSIDHHNRIDNFCHIAPNCALCGNVTIYNGVFIGNGSSIVPKISIKAWSFFKANSLVKETTAPIQIYEPYLSKYKTSAFDAINSGWIGYHGKYIGLATEKLKKVLDAKYVILTNNGTTATHCLFITLKYKYPNINKIYVPNNVYVAVWNSALMEYDEKQLEVMKIDPETWNISTEKDYIMSLDTKSAVFIVHNIGNIINVPKLKLMRPDIIFIEDNCEGLFGRYETYYTGTSATLCSSISFFDNETTATGGAVICSDEDIYEYLNKTCHQGATNKHNIEDVFGYNYRMTNIQAAFLYDQLCDISIILDMKKKIFKNYELLLQNIPNDQIQLQKVNEGVDRANWIFALRIVHNPSYEILEKHMNLHGVVIRPMFYPIHKHKHLQNIKTHNESCQLSIMLNRECIMLPSSPSLTDNEQMHIIDQIKSYINKSVNPIVNNIIPSDELVYSRPGIGDIIIMKQIYDHFKLKNKIIFNLNLIATYRENKLEYVKFIRWFIERLFGTHNISYINDTSHNLVEFHNYFIKEDALRSIQHYFNLDPIDNFSDDYIIFHSKCRFDYDNWTFTSIYKPKIIAFLSNFKSKYKIVILGERVMSSNYETRVHNMESIYNELMLLKNNNIVIDMTEQELANTPSSEIFQRDIKIINQAKVNIGVGFGGNFVITTAFSKKLEFFIGGLTHAYFDNIINLNNTNYRLHNNIDQFLASIQQY
ncbi:MAG: hypothetical protein Hyperionvirus21_32 [Hyperionvirus sp.]|uniref:Uncharacterized protein n=1 Tax=Hyperionvirus sp. TaxID=2487770 RepID=A0A3G5AAP1_9VIRU|nr:MAG: hypothetical protein Hyperionvirus21_32 [Hyperionvirus sp.]